MAENSSLWQPPKPATEPHSILTSETLSDFNSLQYQRLLNDPSYTSISPATRSLGPPGTTFNNLMAKTLFTPTTIRAIQYLYRPGSPDDDISQTPGRVSGDLIALISIGDEICSHPDTLHGGMQALLVDEIGGALAMKESSRGTSMMLVNFNVNLRKSVRAPGVVVGRAWRGRREEGRKWWVRITIEQDGVRCVDSECLYVKLKTDNSKL